MLRASLRSPVTWFGLLIAGAGGLGAWQYQRLTHEPASDSIPLSPEHASADCPVLPMDESQREHIWDIEHHGLLLGKRGFPLIADALKKSDRSALLALLSSDFAGGGLAEPREVQLPATFAQVRRLQQGGKAPRPLSRDAFVDELLQVRSPFPKPPQVQFALMNFSPSQSGDPEAPWEGGCQLRIFGQIGPGRPGETAMLLRFRVAQPTEERLKQPGWLLACTIEQMQVASAPRFLMHDATAARGIDPRPFHDNWRAKSLYGVTGGVYVCDFDRDGILDLLITDVNRYAFYKGLPDGRFSEVTDSVGLPVRPAEKSPLATLAAFVDLDGDGWEDLILGGRIYRNQGNRFADVTSRSNLRLPRDATGVALADFDRDGRVDLYVTRLGQAKGDSWMVGKSGLPQRNQLWRNRGNWQFEEVARAGGADAPDRSSFTAAWLDANNDGWPDLYVLNEFGNGVLLINRGNGTFQEQSIVDGPSDFGSMGVTCGDYDNDGNIDIYVANMYSKAGNRVIGNVRPGTYPESMMAKVRQFVAGNQLYHNRGADLGEPKPARPGGGSTLFSSSQAAVKFDRIGSPMQVAGVGWAHGVVFVDLDNDGWLDLFSTAGYMSQSRDEPDG